MYEVCENIKKIGRLEIFLYFELEVDSDTIFALKFKLKKNINKFKHDNMTTQIKTKTLYQFHIGRGGRFYNAGHKSFIGTVDSITSTDAYNKLSTPAESRLDCYLNDIADANEVEVDDITESQIKDYMSGLGWSEQEIEDGHTNRLEDNWEYVDDNGNSVGLTVGDANSGVGVIDIDGQYDTTIVCSADDLSEDDIEIIINSNRLCQIEVDELYESLNFLKN